jgi:hydrogenase nickel incorporation protein HypA/HybF
VKRLLGIALERAAEAGAVRIAALDITVGELCDGEPRWMERYFRIAARGTAAEGAALRFRTEAATAKCGTCGRTFAPELRGKTAPRCPGCGGDECELTGGLDYRLERMEVI